MTKSTITREPITHDIKIYPEFFSAVCTGVKRAELRKNDRDYRVGDTPHLMETPRGSCHQTGEFINVKITHIADVGEWMPGYVLLSVELQERRKADSEPVILYRQVNPVNGMKTYWAELDPEEFRHLKKYTDENAEFMTLYRHAQPAPVVPVVPDELLKEYLRLVQCMLSDYRDGNHGAAQRWIRHIAKASDVFAEKHGLSPWEMAKKTFAHHPAHCVCDNCINARSKWDYV